MCVLLLRLSGSMQSWGVQGRFSVRDTGLEPSKSGVIGLLCAALGRRRDDPVDDLAALTMGVRVDQEGKLARDFHTAMNVLKASGGIKVTEPSARYYLADARFLVGLEGENLDLLTRVHAALRDPHWPRPLAGISMPILARSRLSSTAGCPQCNETPDRAQDRSGSRSGDSPRKVCYAWPGRVSYR